MIDAPSTPCQIAANKIQQIDQVQGWNRMWSCPNLLLLCCYHSTKGPNWVQVDFKSDINRMYLCRFHHFMMSHKHVLILT